MPMPYQSGASAREPGMTKAGNRHVRWMATELAWGWVRYQPESALRCWFKDRFGIGGKRLRRIGIVVVARLGPGAGGGDPLNFRALQRSRRVDGVASYRTSRSRP